MRGAATWHLEAVVVGDSHPGILGLASVIRCHRDGEPGGNDLVDGIDRILDGLDALELVGNDPVEVLSPQRET